MKISLLKKRFLDELHVYPSSERLVFFQRLCAAYLNLKPHQIVLNYGKEVSASDLSSFEQALIRLKNHEPVQYILGQTSFFGLTFSVSASVLIPRPETEELVAWILNHFDPSDAPKIIDLGTGSGCIAIALAHALPNAEVFALDVSPDALELAHFNAKANEVKVNFIEANMLEWNSNKDFDVVVSNPPYVCKQERELMKDNVLAYEPHLALFVADEAPLVFYKAIKDIALNNLKSSGLCFAEINEHYGYETKALFDAINFENRVIKKDTFGKDRMLKVQKK